jgi:hypothetical protein
LELSFVDATGGFFEAFFFEASFGTPSVAGAQEDLPFDLEDYLEGFLYFNLPVLS